MLRWVNTRIVVSLALAATSNAFLAFGSREILSTAGGHFLGQFVTLVLCLWTCSLIAESKGLNKKLRFFAFFFMFGVLVLICLPSKKSELDGETR